MLLLLPQRPPLFPTVSLISPLKSPLHHPRPFSFLSSPLSPSSPSRRNNVIAAKKGESKHENSWIPPPPGCIKFNTDAAVKQPFIHEFVGVGIAGRDHLGNPVGLWYARMSLPNVVITPPIGELLATKAAYQLAFELGYCFIISETDSLGSLDMVNNRRSTDHHLTELAIQVADLQEQFISASLVFCPHTSNKLAHWLAKKTNPLTDVNVFHSMPLERGRGKLSREDKNIYSVLERQRIEGGLTQ